MPLGASSIATWVATLSACHSSICAVPAMNLYSRRERSRDDGANGTERAGKNSVRVSTGGVQPVPKPAAGGGIGVSDVFRDDVRGNFRATGVERAGRPLGELRGHVPLCWISGRRAGAGGGATVLLSAVGAGEGEEVGGGPFEAALRRKRRARRIMSSQPD